jgi:hypothetical protein
VKIQTIPPVPGYYEFMALLRFAADPDALAGKLAELERVRSEINALIQGREDLSKIDALKAETEQLLASAKAERNAARRAVEGGRGQAGAGVEGAARAAGREAGRARARGAGARGGDSRRGAGSGGALCARQRRARQGAGAAGGCRGDPGGVHGEG